MLNLREDTIARSGPLGISGQLRDRSQSTHSSFEGDEIQISNADKFYFVFSPLSSSAVTTDSVVPRRELLVVGTQRDMDEREWGGMDRRTMTTRERTQTRRAAVSRHVGLDHGRGIKKCPAVQSLLNSPLKNRVKPKREKYASPNIMLEKEMVENCA